MRACFRGNPFVQSGAQERLENYLQTNHKIELMSIKHFAMKSWAFILWGVGAVQLILFLNVAYFTGNSWRLLISKASIISYYHHWKPCIINGVSRTFSVVIFEIHRISHLEIFHCDGETTLTPVQLWMINVVLQEANGSWMMMIQRHTLRFSNSGTQNLIFTYKYH